jgi:hypothetical protein
MVDLSNLTARETDAENDRIASRARCHAELASVTETA